MTSATEVRLEEPCRFCAGPRVMIVDKEHTFTPDIVLHVTMCLRCDGPAPLRVPVVPATDEQPQDGAA